MNAVAPEIIAVKLSRAAQLFNSLDPSPFHEKDLDSGADAFIVGWLMDIGAKPFAIIVHLPESERENAQARDIPAAIRFHFVSRAAAERRQLRLELRRGYWALLVGLIFLAACLGLREALLGFTFPGQNLFAEGLLIIGWVAMWGPIEVFLYSWWPIAGRAETLERLAKAEVRVEFGG